MKFGTPHAHAPKECLRPAHVMEPKKSFLFIAQLFYVWPPETETLSILS